jgi:putative oxidoreductase
MTKSQFIDYIIAIARIYLALVFILSGLDKINNLAGFAESIENYRILPEQIINIVAIIIPWLELIAGALLLMGYYIKENSLISLALLVVFTFAVFSAVLRNLNIDCGCFGTFNGQKVGMLKISENIILIIIALISIKYPRQVLTFIKIR